MCLHPRAWAQRNGMDQFPRDPSNEVLSINGDQELPEDYFTLLTKYLIVAPYLVPKSTGRLASANITWHPDLHSENIFVDLITGKITGIVD